ncbi:MAG: alpha/beta fold hydrolase [Bacteroidota bacterium]
MKRRIRKVFTTAVSISSLFISFNNFSLFGQPDLTANYANVLNPLLHKGQNLRVNLSIKNIGNQTSGNSNIAFWLSPTTSTSSPNAVFLTQISLPPINANSTYSFNFVYPIPYATSSGANFFLFSIDNQNLVSETNETNNLFYAITTVNVQSNGSQDQHLPYPVLLVHGLSSSDQTWSNFISDIRNIFGWNYGGSFHFCLNQDGDNSNAQFINDFQDYTNLSNVYKSDFYTINFDVQNSGTIYNTNVLSNQSAIFKQGYAVRNAVNYIMQKTGRNKVILLGHSMGGLASREYVQNPSKYQSDGQHHIAKIITLGTPHGGSNAGPTFSPLTPDGQSEAIRDLRTSYYYSGNPGVFLFGGLEDLPYMDDQLCCYFYNADVNCNGITSETIIGLNQKPFPNNIDIVCNIGDGDILGGDGVVSTTSADLNNYIASVNADTFIMMKTGLTTWHLQLTQQTHSIIRSFDEPRISSYAYEINDSTYYFGLLNIPSRKYTYSNIDIDYYKLSLNQGTLSIHVMNIPTPQFTVSLLNSSGTTLYNIPSNGKSEIAQNLTINTTGTYYLKISGLANDSCYSCQYAIYFTNPSIITDISNVQNYNPNISIYPNPASDYIYMQTKRELYPLKYKIFSIDGKLVNDGTFNYDDILNVKELLPAVYLLYVQDSQQNVFVFKLIKY